ncbi:MAG: DUF192 domain-containing protein [Parvularculaceae bacterium]
MAVRFFMAAAAFFAAFSAYACAPGDGPGDAADATDNLVIVSETGEHRFRIEIADTDESRRLGLMYRTELAADAGMLFIYDEPRPISMWMKNTLIPLDMAFIDGDGVIRRIAADTTPRSLESISSGAPAVAVLEVNAGTFARLGVKPGDRVRHSRFSKP